MLFGDTLVCNIEKDIVQFEPAWSGFIRQTEIHVCISRFGVQLAPKNLQSLL